MGWNSRLSVGTTSAKRVLGELLTLRDLNEAAGAAADGLLGDS